MEWTNGFKSWWVEGKKVSEEEFIEKRSQETE